jgi:hypothetical protein
MEDGFANSVIKHDVNKYRPFGDTESFVIRVGQPPGDFWSPIAGFFIMCSERWMNEIVL